MAKAPRQRRTVQLRERVSPCSTLRKRRGKGQVPLEPKWILYLSRGIPGDVFSSYSIWHGQHDDELKHQSQSGARLKLGMLERRILFCKSRKFRIGRHLFDNNARGILLSHRCASDRGVVSLSCSSSLVLRWAGGMVAGGDGVSREWVPAWGCSWSPRGEARWVDWAAACYSAGAVGGSITGSSSSSSSSASESSKIWWFFDFCPWQLLILFGLGGQGKGCFVCHRTGERWTWHGGVPTLRFWLRHQIFLVLRHEWARDFLHLHLRCQLGCRREGAAAGSGASGRVVSAPGSSPSFPLVSA